MRKVICAFLLAALVMSGSAGCNGSASDVSDQGGQSQTGSESTGSDTKAADE